MRVVPRKVRTLGCEVDALTLEAACSLVLSWVDEIAQAHENGGAQELPCRFVVTPNLDHAVLLGENNDLRAAYQDAALVLADGMPLVWASKLFGRSLPERVAGSDLAPAVLQAAAAGTKVFFLGATDESSKKAVENVRARYPQVDVVGRLSPPMGFEHSEEWSDRIVSEIRASKAALLVVGLGAPKQEIWVQRHQTRLPDTVALCVGATIDFLAGTVERAPVWAQQLGVEWVHRLLSDPKRLAMRYGRDAIHLPRLLYQDARAARRDSISPEAKSNYSTSQK